MHLCRGRDIDVWLLGGGFRVFEYWRELEGWPLIRVEQEPVSGHKSDPLPDRSVSDKISHCEGKEIATVDASKSRRSGSRTKVGCLFSFELYDVVAEIAYTNSGG